MKAFDTLGLRGCVTRGGWWWWWESRGEDLGKRQDMKWGEII